MAATTANFVVKVEDGWVKVASAVSTFLYVSAHTMHTWFIWIGSGTPTANPAKATGTVTNSSLVPSDGDTVTIGGQVFTFKTTPVAATDVQITALNIATTMTAFQASVNANSVQVTAGAPSSGVVTLTAITAGTVGNAITLAKSGTNLAVSGTTLTGGLDPALGMKMYKRPFVDSQGGLASSDVYVRVQEHVQAQPQPGLQIDVISA